MNDHLVLVSGKSSTGKSASLMFMDDPKGVMYLNTEAGKKLPFKSKFEEYTIIDPMQVTEALEAAEGMQHIHTIVIDSLTYLMDMYESVYVLTASNGMKAWGDYGQFFKILMQQKVTAFNKPTIFTAHLKDVLDEKNMEMKTFVPVKGALQNNGIEAYFSTVVAAKKVPIKELEKYQNDLLHISDEERELRP